MRTQVRYYFILYMSTICNKQLVFIILTNICFKLHYKSVFRDLLCTFSKRVLPMVECYEWWNKNVQNMRMGISYVITTYLLKYLLVKWKRILRKTWIYSVLMYCFAYNIRLKSCFPQKQEDVFSWFCKINKMVKQINSNQSKLN